MTKHLKCHRGVGPKVTGIALVADDNFSARYDLDRIKGIFSRPQHKLAGQFYKVCTIRVPNRVVCTLQVNILFL